MSDNNPEAHNPQPQEIIHNPTGHSAIDTPEPHDTDNDLVCDEIRCVDDDPCLFSDIPDLNWLLRWCWVQGGNGKADRTIHSLG